MSPAPPHVRRVRLATFNIAHGRGRDRRVDLRRTVTTLAALDADVLCLQEVDRHYGRRSGWADQGAELAAALGMTSVYGASVRLDADRNEAPDREYGNAVLARGPLRRLVVHPLPVQGRSEPRSLLLAEQDDLVVGCVHLQHDDPAARTRQAAAVLAALPTDRPLVLAGDFNADPGDAELSALRGRLTDVWPGAGQGRAATFPSRWPRRRLDQVLIAPGVRATGARVVGTDASDHRPVVVDLVVGQRR